MISVSLCMIVKNEAEVLERCLDSLKGIYDEAIIVDTGSTDNTREIALKYTDKVFDFKWIDDFSAARNFAISKACCDYIYVADADEVIDEPNRKAFLELKRLLLEEIDIVQMKYTNQLDNSTVYNFDSEYRVKLFKRMRPFVFMDPIHETLRTDPIVYDSDIEIIHMPQGIHSDRDLKIFEKATANKKELSTRLISMYAKELLISGTKESALNAREYFLGLYDNPKGLDEEDLKVVYIVLSYISLLDSDVSGLMTFSLKDMAMGGTSEVCSILGTYYEQIGQDNEASMWYYNARYETKPVICLKYNESLPLEGLIRLAKKYNNDDDVAIYTKDLANLTK